jgi:hypothetical protein
LPSGGKEARSALRPHSGAKEASSALRPHRGAKEARSALRPHRGAEGGHDVSRYLLRRLLLSVPVLFGISIVLFAILALAPGDPFAELALNPNIPPEVRANLRQQFGLDDPLAVRYARWLLAMLHGDWGYSFVSRLPVRGAAVFVL